MSYPEQAADFTQAIPEGVALNRRRFLVTSLAAGFALAVQPVQADSVIHTDRHGLVDGEVKIPVADGEIPGYYARPAGDGTYPTILVIQEIFGVHEYIRDVCRRLAHAGYFAVAPALFAREGDVSTISDISTIIKQVVSKVPDAQVMSDLDQTVAWARQTGHADVDKLGINGFCWGGRISWLYAEHNPKLQAAVAWYGPLAGATTPNTPSQPADHAAALHAPVLGLYGGADDKITPQHIEQMRQAVKTAGKTADFIVYPGAPHGFHADYRPSYRPEAAEDGWKHMLNWFKQYGVA